jgi:uncharacterized protein
MKKCWCIIFLLLFADKTYPLEIPRLHGYVNDYAGLCSQQRTFLSSKLARFGKTNGAQIVILTIPSSEGQDMAEYSIKTAEKWKLGQKGKGNGVILIVEKKTGWIRIEVGRGLSGTLTDLRCGRIIQKMEARFRAHDNCGALNVGVDEIMKAVEEEAAYQKNTKRKGDSF